MEVKFEDRVLFTYLHQGAMGFPGGLVDSKNLPAMQTTHADTSLIPDWEDPWRRPWQLR